MQPEAGIKELRARLELMKGAASLLVAITENDGALEETRRLLRAILAATPMQIEDLGVCEVNTGPARWAEQTRRRSADAYLLSASPRGPLVASSFAGLLNAEREFLRQLAGPVVLLIPRATEQVLRQRAPDFMTWAAQSVELPRTEELSSIARRLGATPELIEPPAPEEEPIRFLHLSDFHLRPQRVKRYDQDRVLRGLVEFLERDRPRFPLDLLFVTGDLAHGGKADEYEVVSELLRRLLEVTGVPPERTFVVPGNHDVDRDVGRWLLRTLHSDEESTRFFVESGSRRFHAEKLEAYRASMAALLGGRRPLGLGVGADAVEIVEVRGARLAVASFNSAWFAQADDDRGALWLGEAGVDGAEGRIADEGIGFAIALMHHPLDELHEIERYAIERRLDRVFDLVLRGHLHQERTRAIASQRGGYVEVAAPAAYQGSQWPNGCFLGEIRPGQRKVRLRPYAYASGADPWVLDTKVFPDDAEDGYCRTFQVPERRRLPTAMVQPVKRAAEAVVSGADLSTREELARQLGVAASAGALTPGAAQQVEKSVDEALRAAVADAMGGDRSGHGEHAPLISRSDPDFLEKALVRAGDIVDQVRAAGGLQVSGHALVQMLIAALTAVVEGPVHGELMLPSPDGLALHLDILIGGFDDPPEKRAIIEVKVSELKLSVQAAVLQVQYYQRRFPARGAVVLIGLPESHDGAPRLQRIRVDNQDILALRLPR